VVGQSWQTTDINATAGVTVNLCKTRLVGLLAPAFRSEWRRRVVDALLGLCNTGLDLDRSTKHIGTIELNHSALGMVFVLQVDEAVGRVTASERVYGDIYAVTIKSSVSELFTTKFKKCTYIGIWAALNNASTSSVLAV